jgi:hypothetical protein
MSDGQDQAGASTQAQPSEDELRAAYEAELNRITSSEMILQTTVSLLNIGGRRLGLGSAPTPGSSGDSPPPADERDLEQAQDAIDGASALLPILERRMPGELGPLRDAIAQLQVAYAREAQTGSATPPAAQVPPAEQPKPATSQEKPQEDGQGPGPAQSSGRLWVPGR